MKLVHLSDTHLGKRQYNSSAREQDFVDAFEEVIDTAIDIEADAVIHTGDIFDSKSPSIDTLDIVADLISRLNNKGIPFYSILGNHDGRWIDIVNRDVEGHGRLSENPRLVTDDEDVSVAIYGFDHFTPAQWDYDNLTLNQPPEPVDHTLVGLHQYITPPIVGAESEDLQMYDTHKILDSFDTQVDVLTSGHYHEPCQDMVDDTLVYICGATERTKKNQKSAEYAILDITKDNVSLEKKAVTCTRPIVRETITLEGGESLSSVRKQLSDNSYTFSRQKDSLAVITLEGTPNGISAQNIKEIVLDLGAGLVEVVDNRTHLIESDIDLSELRESQESLEDRVDSALDDQDFSSKTIDLESRFVRKTEEVPKIHVREEVEEFITGDDDETHNED
jgi:DNA repair exonuclease SbcCD nuclease subunit